MKEKIKVVNLSGNVSEYSFVEINSVADTMWKLQTNENLRTTKNDLEKAHNIMSAIRFGSVECFQDETVKEKELMKALKLANVQLRMLNSQTREISVWNVIKYLEKIIKKYKVN